MYTYSDCNCVFSVLIFKNSNNIRSKLVSVMESSSFFFWLATFKTHFQFSFRIVIADEIGKCHATVACCNFLTFLSGLSRTLTV